MLKSNSIFLFIAFTFLLTGCSRKLNTAAVSADSVTVKPVIISEKVQFDSDDPAIWINPEDASKSLVIGTDKAADGGLYVFDLQGKIQHNLVVKGLKRPNNVDIAYGLSLNGKPTAIAITTERFTHKLRVFSLPDMKAVDNGGLSMFDGETAPEYRDLMGIAVYTSKTGKIYAIVGRKTGPKDGSYLWQYLLTDDGTGKVKAELVRKFGHYSGKKEIEAIAADNELGYIYYSDEQFGVRQYYADPEKGNEELALFATTGFKEDHEGISIYKTSATTGYILVSDQGANQFQIFSRSGTAKNPFQHELLKIVKVTAGHSDGSEVVNVPLNETFKHGLFVVMSDDKTFHYYRWEDIAGKDLKFKK
ncbi:3-phytase [Pedobacter lusitanus]|uniref:3-phytase n=1 Tax=Pedobacter lusitanus TaxID=1503925 RepID=A0A0D0GD96_9SPHI|nr:phytase [Pedobacter lusitanus]KIO75287.1 3-phytase [Pedobacter lusitanus]